MSITIHSLLEWVTQHPHWAALIVFSVAVIESLVVIGLVVPGSVVIIAAGALIGMGTLHFWPIFFAAVAGAVTGDGLSFWFGHHYRKQIRERWPFKHHPELLNRGEKFFQQHSGKSVLLGRFAGPVRPIIPAVAGMMGMPPLRFYAVNIISALGWAPAHLLPGIAFGASLAVAGEVTGRLAMLLVIFVIASWLLITVTRRLYRYISSRTQQWLPAVTVWARRHRRFSWLLVDLLETDHSPNRALILWVILLTGSTWLFFGVLQDVVSLDSLVQADTAFFHFFQGMRGPVADRIMVFLSGLGDWVVVGVITVFVALWLTWRRAWHDLRYLLVAVAFGVLILLTLKLTLHVPRPVLLNSNYITYSFPGGHTTMSVVVYGFVALLMANELSTQWRALLYTIVALLVFSIAVSRLYLGVQWLSDVIGGLALGGTWIALLAIARRHRPRYHLGFIFIPSIAIVFITASAWHNAVNMDEDLQRYNVSAPARHINFQRWWTSEWQYLPAYRIDLQGEYEQPLNIQWAGSLTQIRQVLLSNGWRDPIPVNFRTVLHYLMPSPDIAKLPVLPQLHNGRYESLLMVLNSADKNTRALVFHLWPTAVSLDPEQNPLWIGTIGWLELERLPLLAFPVTRGDYAKALAATKIVHSEKCVEKVISLQQKNKGIDKSHILLVCREPVSKL